MRTLAVLIALLVSSLAFSGTPTDKPYRFGSRIVKPNDSLEHVVDVAGEPIKKEPIRNEYNAVVAHAWYYKDGDKTIVIYNDGSHVNWIDVRR